MSIFGSLFGRGPDPKSWGPEPLVARNERIYAIGDIHGRADLLAAMVARLRADIARCRDDRVPRLIFLGDYIDRGDQSRQTLDLLAGLERTFPGVGLTFLRGNHEAALLALLSDPPRGADWLRFGGLQTLASYGLTPPRSTAGLYPLRDDLVEALGPHRAFLERTVLMARSGDVVFSHAGVDPDRSLETQTEDALLWGRSGFLDTFGIEGKRVVHGHYASAEPVVTPWRLCVDTGAYYTGRLTAARLDDRMELLTVSACESP